MGPHLIPPAHHLHPPHAPPPRTRATRDLGCSDLVQVFSLVYKKGALPCDGCGALQRRGTKAGGTQLGRRADDAAGATGAAKDGTISKVLIKAATFIFGGATVATPLFGGSDDDG